jgi:hypothetical protein
MLLFLPFPQDTVASYAIRDLKRIKKLSQQYRWKHKISDVDLLQHNLETLLKLTRFSQRKLNPEKLPSILRKHASGINEILQLFQTFDELDRINEIDQNVEQMVTNRSNHLLSKAVEDICIGSNFS